MNDKKILTVLEIRETIQVSFSDHSLIDYFLGYFYYYDLTQQDVLEYYKSFMEKEGEEY